MRIFISVHEYRKSKREVPAVMLRSLFDMMWGQERSTAFKSTFDSVDQLFTVIATSVVFVYQESCIFESIGRH